MSSKSDNLICLVPNNHMCDTINSVMLNKLEGDIVELTAQDIFNGHPSLRKNAEKILKNNSDEDTVKTEKISKLIKIKIGANIMIRRNIDATVGLLNGTIGTI